VALKTWSDICVSLSSPHSPLTESVVTGTHMHPASGFKKELVFLAQLLQHHQSSIG